jgi:hypothetical protein
MNIIFSTTIFGKTTYTMIVPKYTGLRTLFVEYFSFLAADLKRHGHSVLCGHGQKRTSNKM